LCEKSLGKHGDTLENATVTIKDIAKKAEVSVSTVSKAFNNYFDINEKTRAKILKIAQQLNYTPNPVARSLVKNESKRVGLVIEDYSGSGTSKLFAFEILMGFKTYMIENGYEVLLLTTTSNKQKNTVKETHKNFYY
jgi:LacI family transcriptional regulator